MKNKIFVDCSAVALTQDIEKRVQDLCDRLASLPTVEISRFRWTGEVKPGEEISNAFQQSMKSVGEADLAVFILYGGLTPTVTMEIMRRCELSLPLQIFVPVGYRLPPVVNDCIDHYRKQRFGSAKFKDAEMCDPIEYTDEKNILGTVAGWVARRIDKNQRNEIARK